MDAAKLTEINLQCVSCKTLFEKCNPRILPCLHSICPPCFDKLKQDESPVCYLCSESIDWAVTKPDQIPEDHHRRSVFDYLKIMNDKQNELKCHGCNGINTTVRCSDCAASFCQNCLPGHDKFTNNHKVLTFNELRNKSFGEIICPVLCSEHNLPLKRYCHSDQKAICTFCEFSDHQQFADHLVEDIETAFGDRKRELESAISEFKSVTDTVENQKINVENEISNLLQTQEEQERNFDASVNNMIKYFERRRKNFKADLKSRIDEQDDSLDKKRKTVSDSYNKYQAALHFAENALSYLGPEDFCQIENLISARFQSLSGTSQTFCSDVSDMKHLTFVACKVGTLDQYLTSNKWLSLIGYYLVVEDDVQKLDTDDRETPVARLHVYGSRDDNSLMTNPFRVVMRSKEGREIAPRVELDDDKACFVIYCELTTTGIYSLELYLEDELKEKRSLKFTLRQTHEKDVKDIVPFGHKERLDHMDPMTFRQQEMQCPYCNEAFCLEDETRFPCILPCLHVIGTDCILKLIKNGSIECCICNEKHKVQGKPEICFPKDDTRRNLSVYWKIRSEGDFIQCQDHIGVKATVWCQICGHLICDSCSRTHMEKGHQPLVPVPKAEQLKAALIADLHNSYVCKEKGHERRLLELYCITCEKVICHACQFESHQKPCEVKECNKVYKQRHAETKELLQQVTETKRKTDKLSLHVRNEMETLKGNTEKELDRVWKTFNNCKQSLDARKKYIDSELNKISSMKEKDLCAQLKVLEATGTTITTSSNRALDLMEFSSEVAFLKMYSTLKRRLESALTTLKDTHVNNNALIWFIDDFIAKKLQNEAQKMGSIWPGNLCLHKVKIWKNVIVPKQEGVVLKLQFVDNGGKTVSLKNISKDVAAEITKGNCQPLEPKTNRISYGENGVLSVYANIAEAGEYTIMVKVMGSAVVKDGIDVLVQPKGETNAPDNDEKVNQPEHEANIVVVEIGQKPEDVVQIEDSWSRQTREQAATVARLQHENAQLKTSLTQNEKTIKDIEGAQEAAKKQVVDLEKANADNVEKLQTLVEDVYTKVTAITNLQEENKKLTTSLEEKTKAVKATEDSKQNELKVAQETHKKKVDKLQKTSQANLKKAQTLEADVKTKTATIASLQEENKTLTASLEEKTKAVKDQKQPNTSRARMDCDTEDKKQTEIKAAQDAHKTQVDELQKMSEANLQKAQALEADVKTKTATIVSLQQENKKLTASLDEETKAVKGYAEGEDRVDHDEDEQDDEIQFGENWEKEEQSKIYLGMMDITETWMDLTSLVPALQAFIDYQLKLPAETTSEITGLESDEFLSPAWEAYAPSTDRNCLFNSVSAVLYGNESFAYRLRLATFCEGIINSESYSKKYFKDKSKDSITAFMKSTLTLKSLQQLDESQKENVEYLAKFAVQMVVREIAKPESNCNTLQVEILCNAIKFPILQYFQKGTLSFYGKMNKEYELVKPEGLAKVGDLVRILWVNEPCIGYEDNKTINHVVPVIKKHKKPKDKKEK